MKHQFTHIGRTLVAAAALFFAGCSYDDGELWDKVNEMDTRLTKLEQVVSGLNSDVTDFRTLLNAISNNVYITGMTEIMNGYILTFSDGTKVTVKDGSNGQTPTIGANGNWWIGDEDTGVKARGEDGRTPFVGNNGNWWIGTTDTGVKARGEDGQTPFVGNNGNWWIGTTDTGVKARGEDGKDGYTPSVGDNGNWWINGSDTGYKAIGVDGLTPRIGENGNWWIGTFDTNVRAAGEDGKDGVSPRVGPNGNWWIGDYDTGINVATGEGTSASVPVIGVDTYNGVYYWTVTVNGETTWLLDKTDNKLPVSGYAPIFQIDFRGCIIYSVDNGVTWLYVCDENGVPVPVASGGNCTCTQFFQNVYVSGDYLVLILIDGREIRIRIGGGGGSRGDIPEDPTDPTPPLPDDPNVIIPYPRLVPEVDEWGNHIVTVDMTGIQDPNTGEWISLHGTGLTEQNIWIEVDGTPKGIYVINLEDNTTRVKNDIVFTLDNSSSMSQEADAIARDIIAWAQMLTSKNLDVQFGVVGYGGYVDGAMNLTSASALSSYLNAASGTSRTQHFGGSDASSLSTKASSYPRTGNYYDQNECGAMGIRFANDYFSYRATANRIYINFTDEPNQPNGNSGYSVEWFRNQQNWPTSAGTVHTVWSAAANIGHTVNSSERPWLISEYTGGTTMYIRSDASDLQLDKLTVSDALTHAYIIKFIIPDTLLDGMPHTVRIVVIANDGRVRGVLEFTAVFGTL